MTDPYSTENLETSDYGRGGNMIGAVTLIVLTVFALALIFSTAAIIAMGH